MNSSEYYEQYWATGLSGWSPTGVKLSRFEEELLASFVPPRSRVLDFGCGDGSHAASFLVSNQCTYLGTDVSETAVAMCRAKGLDAIRSSSEAPLPFDGDSFDSVLSFEVFEHLFNPLGALKDIHRVLRSGKYLIGSVPNAVYIANRLLMTVGHFSPGGSPATSLKAPWNDPHIRFFSARSVRALLTEAGFRKCLVFGQEFSLGDFPVLYRSAPRVRQLVAVCSRPFASLGKWRPSLFSARLYFAAQK